MNRSVESSDKLRPSVDNVFLEQDTLLLAETYYSQNLMYHNKTNI